MHESTIMLKESLIYRAKSFVWRAGGMAVVAVGAYILQVGDIFILDWKIIANTAVIVVVGLLVGEVTKFLNR